ncbi:alpha/beta hydrolase family protein [Williamsia limnetica]|uniref:Alpha/beta hydrolase family protein n=1 Tax=Williamsia limnetica TaxID=882452 RepID=A0A318RN99_WILLI|nr:alpha/beta hydrolase family protein [Williamsia limnetica]
MSQARTWASNAHFLATTATGIDTAVDTFDTAMNDIATSVATTMDSWRGDAAEASQAQSDSEKQASNRLAITILDIADAITRLGPDVLHSTEVVRNWADSIIDAGFLVSEDGSVAAPADSCPGHPREIPADMEYEDARAFAARRAAEYQSYLTGALATAGSADAILAAEITTTLGELLQNADRATTVVPLGPAVRDILAGRSRLPADPQALNEFWDSLTSAEKAALWDHNRAIGGMDGIPVADRDHFNRRYLGELQNDARGKVIELEGLKPDPAEYPTRNGPGEQGNPSGYRRRLEDWQRLHDSATADLAALIGLQNTVTGQPGAKKRHLMLIDRKGLAAVAVNNPDTADNVATYVPGTGANLAGIGGGVDRAEKMVQSAADVDESAQTAVVTWFGYDAPPNLIEAGAGVYAARGADPLAKFQDGLRATHEGAGRSHNTIISHSYGTVVAAEAASGRRALNVDDVVFVASPGLGGPDDVGDLNLAGPDDRANSRRVWATVSTDDVINLIEVVHGADPHDGGFGAQVFASERGPGVSLEAHSNYWDENSVSLLNMGRIIARKYADVQ